MQCRLLQNSYRTRFAQSTAPHEASKIGKEVAQMYRLEVGEEFASGVYIPQKLQSVNGRVDHVNVYGTKPVRPGKRSGQQIIHDVLLRKGLIN